jgi:hypothetical protein
MKHDLSVSMVKIKEFFTIWINFIMDTMLIKELKMKERNIGGWCCNS